MKDLRLELDVELVSYFSKGFDVEQWANNWTATTEGRIAFESGRNSKNVGWNPEIQLITDPEPEKVFVFVNKM